MHYHERDIWGAVAARSIASAQKIEAQRFFVSNRRWVGRPITAGSDKLGNQTATNFQSA